VTNDIDRERGNGMKNWSAFGLVLATLAATQMASAADFDGKKPILCSTSLAIECEADYECHNSPPEINAIPPFIRVDVKKKTLSGRRWGKQETTAIERVEHNGNRLMLQGVDEGRGWTLAIAEETGRMAITISEVDAAFILFGSCITQ
jgi:hypothetical protein